MNIKRAAAEALATYLKDKIPQFKGNISSQWADEEEIAVFPSLRILPQKMSFSPFQDDELDDTADNRLVLSVGDFEGDFELRLFARSQPEREDLEQRVLDAFMLREGAPGVLTTVTEPVTLNVLGEGEEYTLYQAPVTFTLDNDEWEEEKVFSKKRFTYMSVYGLFPALVSRAVKDIDYLHLGIAEDLNATAPTEDVTVNEDGTFTPA